MKTIGILAMSDYESSGVYHYTRSMVDALLLDKSNRYVLFVPQNSTGYEGLPIEARVLAKRKTSIFQKLIRAAQLALGIRRPWFFSDEEKRLLADIDLFVSPRTDFYPHFFLNKPFVVTIHDLQDRYFPNFFPFLKRMNRRFVYQICARSALRVLCESRFVRQDIMRFLQVPEERIDIIPAPPPLELLKSPPSEDACQKAQKTFDLPREFLFYPAQFWHHKNHLRLLDAFAKLRVSHPELKLVLTGSKANLYADVAAKVKELELESSVIHLGYIQYEELKAIYSLATALVMPTLFESVSIPIYEAFALGTPVCSSNAVALPEQVGDAGLIFDPTNVDDITAKIDELLRDSNLAQALSERGRARINGFDHSSYLKQLQNSLNKASYSIDLA